MSATANPGVDIRRTILAVGLIAFASSSQAVEFGEDFQGLYSFSDLGMVPDLLTPYGGLAFLPDDPDVLLIGGHANTGSGLLYTIRVNRDEQNHIVSFSCTPAPYGAVGEFNDGGVTFGPGDVLFTARWPEHELGQTRPGSTDEDRIDDLSAHGIVGDSSLSALNFVPAGFPGAGQLKMVTYPGGSWYTMPITPDGSGTYDLGTATAETTITGGPEGFVYIDPVNPGFGDYSVLVSEYSAGNIATYAIDSNGDPIPTTRRGFLTGLSGAEGATIDPLTGDFLFSTFGGGNHVVVVRGFVTDLIFSDSFDNVGSCD